MNFKRFHESKNLFDKTANHTTGTTTYNYTISGLDPNKYYTCSTNFERVSGIGTASLYFNGGDSLKNGVWSDTPRTFKPDSNGDIIVYIRYLTMSGAPAIYDDLIAGTIWVMVNEGSTPLPYEPYGDTWTNTPHYIHNTSTDIITTPAVLYPNGTTATVGLKGQMVQSSTPSPQTPIQLSECGERTGNLFDEVYSDISGTIRYRPIFVGDGTFTLSTTTPYDSSVANVFLLSGNVSSGASTSGNGAWKNHNVTAQSVDGYVTIAYRHYSGTTSPVDCQTMLNSGSTPLPYEPYGIKIPILSAGQTTNVYLGEVQTTRKVKKMVLTGNEQYWSASYWSNAYVLYGAPAITRPIPVSNIGVCSHFVQMNGQVMQSGRFNIQYTAESNRVVIGFGRSDIPTLDDFKTYLQQQYANGTPVCVWYVLATPTTGIVNEPIRKISTYADEVSGITIPTTVGANTVDVLTTLKPSEVSINYKGWHPVADVHEAGRTVNIYDKYNTVDIPNVGVRYGIECEAETYSIYNNTDNVVYYGTDSWISRHEACSPHSTATVTLYTSTGTMCGFFMPYNDGSLGEVTIVQGATVPDHYIPYIDWD